jgi:iron only hydrogenase large subunit-like protein
MANFDDITGWREELAAFEKTEEGQAFFAENKRYGGRKMPYENVVQMVDLILTNKELHEALKKKIWFVAYTEEHDLEPHQEEFWDLNPIEAADTFIAFERWYLVKANVPFDEDKIIVARWLAIDLEEGKLTTLRTEEARDFIKEHYAQFVTFPGEEV